MPDAAIQGNSDFGVPGYGGPCPPVGDIAHAYIFTVYALSVDKLPLGENSTAPNTGFVLDGKFIIKSVLNRIQQAIMFTLKNKIIGE